MIHRDAVAFGYTKTSRYSRLPPDKMERNAAISRIILIAGDHSMLVTRLVDGRRAGRFALAYKFHCVWRFVTDVDTDELLTWKTEEEALIIGEAWRQAWETIRFPAPEKKRRAR